MPGGVTGYSGCLLCQKRLRFSWKVDECKPLRAGHLPSLVRLIRWPFVPQPLLRSVLVGHCQLKPVLILVLASAWFQRLNQNYDELHSSFAFKIKLRPYILGEANLAVLPRCRGFTAGTSTLCPPHHQHAFQILAS